MGYDFVFFCVGVVGYGWWEFGLVGVLFLLWGCCRFLVWFVFFFFFFVFFFFFFFFFFFVFFFVWWVRFFVFVWGVFFVGFFVVLFFLLCFFCFFFFSVFADMGLFFGEHRSLSLPGRFSF